MGRPLTRSRKTLLGFCRRRRILLLCCVLFFSNPCLLRSVWSRLMRTAAAGWTLMKREEQLAILFMTFRPLHRHIESFHLPSSESETLPSRGWSPTALWAHVIVLLDRISSVAAAKCWRLLHPSSGFRIAFFLLADVRLIFFRTVARSAGRDEGAMMKSRSSWCHSGVASC